MAFKFNVFTGTLDITDEGGTLWLPPVANEASLPTTDPDGAVRNVLDQDVIYAFDATTTQWHRSRIDVGAFQALADAAGISLTQVDTGDISRHELRLHAATSTSPGGVSTGAQNFAGDKTFDNNVIITGDLTVNGTQTIINTATLDVEDQNISVNVNGNDISAEGAGLTVVRTGTNGSLVYEDALASKWKAGALGSEIELMNVSATQVVTNKNLKSNTNLLTGASADSFQRETGNQSVISIPDAAAADDFLLANQTQNVANKTLNNTNSATLLDTNLTLQDDGDNTKQARFNASSITTGNTRTYDLPDGNTELVGTDVTQTLTNKTINGDNNTLQDIAITSLKTEAADANKFIERDGSGAVISGKAVPSGDVVGTSDSQTLTNKTIDVDNNTVSNIEDDNIKTGAAINAAKIADGSVSNTEFQALDGVSSGIQGQLDGKVSGPASATDDALPRFDGTTGKLVQNSGVTLNDSNEMSGLAQVNVDNLRIDGNTISSTDTDGDVILDPNGNGEIDASTSKVKNVVDPTNDQDAATKKYVDDNTSFVPGDLDEVNFALSNNQASFVDVTGVLFSNAVNRSAELQYSIAIDATADLFESGKIMVVQRGADWVLSQNTNGDNSQVLFDITPAGQLQYRSADYPGFVSGTLKVRALTTSV